jgi:hypothetical protein
MAWFLLILNSLYLRLYMRFSLKVICVVFVILLLNSNVSAAEKREVKRVLILAGHYKNMPAIKLV